MATAPPLVTEVRRCLAQQPSMLGIDLVAVTFFGSSGYYVLGVAHRESGHTAVRVVTSRAVLRVLELAGLLPHLALYATRADALADIDQGTALPLPDAQPSRRPGLL